MTPFLSVVFTLEPLSSNGTVLLKKCKGKAGDSNSRVRLNRFRNGLHPVYKGKWPLDAEANPPAQFSELVSAC